MLSLAAGADADERGFGLADIE